MAVRVFNHSPHVVHTVTGVPIPSQGYADVPLADVEAALEKGKLRLIADMAEVIPPIITDNKITEYPDPDMLVGKAKSPFPKAVTAELTVEQTDEPETPITAVPAISQNGGGSSTIKSKRARSKRPSSAKE